jgi:SlyX protein
MTKRTWNDDERIEIETRLVFQEDTIAKLNDALVDQQRQLDQMRDTLARLVELVERREEPAEFKVEQERPPHY